MRRVRLFAMVLALLFGAGAMSARAEAETACSGKFVNPITDVCWSCLFPLSIGSMKIWPSGRADPSNPGSPICACGNPVPRIGRGQIQGPTQVGGASQNTSKWHVHWYVYPLLYWMEILTDFACFEQSSFDIAYMTEVDPTWQDDTLTAILNPEAALFTSKLAQAACAGDCVAATAKLPIDKVFWCAGCQGPMYPINGNVDAHIGHVQASRLALTRFAFKMHREGLAWGTMGTKGLCNKYLMPMMRKQQYRVQMVNPIPTVNGNPACSPLGASTMPPQAGRSYPVKGEDMGYLVWRKRNCCVL